MTTEKTKADAPPEEETLTEFERLIRDNRVSYRPLGGSDDVLLTPNMVEAYLVTPTKSGKLPTRKDVIGFIMLCKARHLDPWVGDAFLVGYDAKDGPQFNLITSFQALLKRAERHETYRGIRSGIIVDAGGKIEKREGEFKYPKDKLLGAWAQLQRKDHDVLVTHTINLDAYQPKYGSPRWSVDPEGMLVKCCKAKAIREEYPNETQGLYTAEERGAIEMAADKPSITTDRDKSFVEAATQRQDKVERVADIFLAGERPLEQPQEAVDTEEQHDAPRTTRTGPRKAQAGTQTQGALIDKRPDARDV